MRFHTVCLHLSWFACCFTFVTSYAVSIMSGNLTYPLIYLSDSISKSPGSMVGGFGLSMTAFFLLMGMLARQVIIGYLCRRQQRHVDGRNEYFIAKFNSASTLTSPEPPSREYKVATNAIPDKEVVAQWERVNKDNLKSIKVAVTATVALVAVGAVQTDDCEVLHKSVSTLYFGSLIYYVISQHSLDLRLVQLGIIHLSPRMLLCRKAIVYGVVVSAMGFAILLATRVDLYAVICEAITASCLMAYVGLQHDLCESVEISLAVRMSCSSCSGGDDALACSQCNATPPPAESLNRKMK